MTHLRFQNKRCGSTCASTTKERRSLGIADLPKGPKGAGPANAYHQGNSHFYCLARLLEVQLVSDQETAKLRVIDRSNASGSGTTFPEQWTPLRWRSPRTIYHLIFIPKDHISITLRKSLSLLTCSCKSLLQQCMTLFDRNRS